MNQLEAVDGLREADSDLIYLLAIFSELSKLKSLQNRQPARKNLKNWTRTDMVVDALSGSDSAKNSQNEGDGQLRTLEDIDIALLEGLDSLENDFLASSAQIGETKISPPLKSYLKILLKEVNYCVF